MTGGEERVIHIREILSTLYWLHPFHGFQAQLQITTETEATVCDLALLTILTTVFSF